MKLKTNIVNKHHIQTQAQAQVQWSARAMVKISRKSAALCELTLSSTDSEDRTSSALFNLSF